MLSVALCTCEVCFQNWVKTSTTPLGNGFHWIETRDVRKIVESPSGFL